MIGLRLVDGFNGCLQIRPRVHRNFAKLVTGRKPVAEIIWLGNVELFKRSSIIQQSEQLNFGGAEIDLSSLQVGFVLHALQLQPVEIDLRYISSMEAISADLEHVVVVRKIVFCQLQDGFGLQGRHKCASQIKEQSPFKVAMTELGNQCPLLGAFQPQVAFMPPFVQVADAG